jgi:hypothetical protein
MRSEYASLLPSPDYCQTALEFIRRGGYIMIYIVKDVSVNGCEGKLGIYSTS